MPAATPMWRDNSTCNTLCGAMIASPTPCTAQQQPRQHQTRQDNSSRNIMCGEMMPTTTPTRCDNSAHNTMCSTTTVPATPHTVQRQCLQHHTWHDDSARNTTHGTTVATTMPNMVLHALDLLGLYVLID